MGVNENKITQKDFIISSSICDANSFSPTMNVLNREFGVDHGFLTTLHPWLNYQNLLDGPSTSFAYPSETYHNYVLGRASPPSLIPKPTSCIPATCKVLPELKGKFLSLSYRIPTAIVSSADVSVKLKTKITKDAIIDIFNEEAKKQKYNIFYNNHEPLVSTDFTASDFSAIIDHRWTMVNNSNYLKLILWYDNEWGYSSRVVDMIAYISEMYGDKTIAEAITI
jgi:glyceraldehyde 3-phosphate dehydrogenase